MTRLVESNLIVATVAGVDMGIDHLINFLINSDDETKFE